MLYQLEVENFFSIKDRQVIDLRVSGKVPDDFGHFGPLFPQSPTRAPKIVAIFGANAAGKTNILAALAFTIHFFRNNRFPEEIATRKDAYLAEFNSNEGRTQPVKFALEFGAIMDATVERGEAVARGEQVPYGVCRYELELAMADDAIRAVLRESLHQRPNDRGKWQRVFERDGDNNVKGSLSFPIKGFEHLLKTLDPKGSIVANFAFFNHPGAKYWQAIANSINFALELHPILFDKVIIENYRQNSALLGNLNFDLQRLDVGIDYMRIEPGVDGPIAKFKHNAMDRELPWHRESNGTRAFIRLYPLIVNTLATGGIAAIDELDAALHPILMTEIFNWFRDKNKNPKNAQLWFTGHAVSSMDDLSMEEILFCEKDPQGCTSVFRARDIARRDDNLRRKYLSGIYGAVPQIG